MVKEVKIKREEIKIEINKKEVEAMEIKKGCKKMVGLLLKYKKGKKKMEMQIKIFRIKMEFRLL